MVVVGEGVVSTSTMVTTVELGASITAESSVDSPKLNVSSPSTSPSIEMVVETHPIMVVSVKNSTPLAEV